MAGFSNTKPLSITIPVSKNLSVQSATFGGKPVYRKCGFINDVGSREVNTSQIVRISVDLGGQGGILDVIGLLHKEINIGMSTSWKEPTLPLMDLIKIGGVTASASQAIQFASNGNLAGGYLLNTRRFWDGTSPLKCSLDIKFVAIHSNNVESEVLEPCIRLQQIASPYIYNVSRAINPPGPGFTDGTGDKITIRIGKFLIFKTVLITSVDVNFDNKCDENGKPLSATCRVSFETQDMIHKTKLDEIAGTPELVVSVEEPKGPPLDIKTHQEAADNVFKPISYYAPTVFTIPGGLQ